MDSIDKRGGKSDLGYLMLDLLFLSGDPKQSQTLIDDCAQDGYFTVGEAMPQRISTGNEMRPEQLIDESRVRVDKTSQLLVSMALAVAQLAKPAYKHPSN